ncbi:VanZ family protein [Flavobacteriaceae bacterium]|nr:VanZ family protein [Flavobacteriaceae bacterium]MDB2684729.1 VanZ family protein [Flavobacteriaceae bacterium]MDC0331848.1 VanZ family protein [Flavobacteriaceae bacterium]MDC0636697.1 VanZ family protein [Flavobacteriaceae bacterium]
MLKHIKALLEDNAIFIAIFFTISITIGSLVKSDVIAIEIVSISDKTIHFIAYFFLMLSWLYVFLKKKSFLKNVKFIFIACIAFGIIIEILQGVTTTYRTLSFLDVAANTLGVLFASTVFYFFEKK